jgi:signal transduction histidine kinase
MMRERRGLPIAAHLALLVALAFGAAYIVNLAIVLALPPRPPDVMRGDVILAMFENGYRAVSKDGRIPRSERARWAILRHRPHADHVLPAGRHLAHALAARINLSPGKIIVTGDAAPADIFVRVQGLKAHMEPGGRFERHIERHETLRRLMVLSARDRLARVDPVKPTIPPEPAQAAAPPHPPEPPAPPPIHFFAPAAGVVLLSGFEIAAELPNGRWLVMRQARNIEELDWIGRAALTIGLTLALLTILALLFAHRLAKPIQSFAEAVQAVGVDPSSAPVAEQGPRELRGAARAVNAMQARLRALVADRTQTLAAVAHDMRTPLMRLRLAAENVAPAQRERMAKEIGDVEALIASFIAFARDDPAQEKRVRLDLCALLQSLADDRAAAGQDVSFAADPQTERLVISGQSLALKRLFSNLIDNAVKFGAAARVTLERSGQWATVDVADEGPGVAPDQRENVFKPFVRLPAQGTATGAGLGLATARSIARAHGGDVVIADSDRGALVRTTLPL